MMYKSAGLLPPNSLEWGNFIVSDLVTRLPELSTLFVEYRTLVNDNQGKAMGITTLKGQKAFIPILVKEWKTLPIDVVLYKKGSEIKGKYISKRNIVQLYISSSLGNPSRTFGDSGVRDSYINAFSPVGGYSYSSNPYFGVGYSNMPKSASDFFNDILEENGLEEFIRREDKSANLPNSISSGYVYMVKTSSDRVELYSPQKPEGAVLTVEDVKPLFNQVSDQTVRAEKVAGFLSGYPVILGNFFPTNNNVLVDFNHFKGVSEHSHHPKLPAGEGIFATGNGPVYINPVTRNTDMTASRYALGVGWGYYKVTTDFGRFKSDYGTEGNLPSREELIPQTKDIEMGKVYSLYNDKHTWMTLPFVVENKVVDEKKNIAITVRQTTGNYTSITYAFKDVEEPVKVREDYFIMPALYSSIVSIPDEYSPVIMETPKCDEVDYKAYMPVEVYCNGTTYSFVEDGVNVLGPFNRNKASFTLMNHYGISKDQAENLITQVAKILRIRLVMPRRGGIHETPSPQLTINQEVPSREKEALRTLVKLASRLLKYSDSEADFGAKTDYLNKRASLQKLLNGEISQISGIKFAATETNDPQQSQSPRVAENNARMGGNGPVRQEPSRPGVLDSLLNSTSIEKNTRDVIDKLLFYYNNKIRTQEGLNLMSELNEKFSEIENALCMNLLLIQMDQLPGQSYNEVRTLLADIDSFLSSVSSSKVLIADR